MKKFSKLFSILLVLALTLALAVPAMAAEKTGTITINNAESGKTYTLYRLLDLSYNGSDKYAYTVNSAWTAFFGPSGAGKDYVKIDALTGTVAWDTDGHGTDKDYQTFAQAASENVPGENAGQKVADGGPVVFADLPLGYYLVVSDAGALCALDTTNYDVEMFEKNQAPTLTKVVDDDIAPVGQTVNFTVTVTKGGEAWADYKVEDTMTGLQLTPDSVQVKVTGKAAAGGTVSEKPLTVVNDYTVDEGTYTAEGKSQTLTVTLSKATLDKYAPGAQFVITYSAVVTGTKVDNNSVTLTYNSTPIGEGTPQTITQKTYVYNYELQVNKVDEKGAALTGAVFQLYTEQSSNTGRAAVQFVGDAGNYTLATPAEISATTGVVTDLNTDDSGKLVLNGLDATTYYLSEKSAPAGYNKLQKDAVLVIEAGTKSEKTRRDYTLSVTFDGKDPAVSSGSLSAPAAFNVVNQTGVEMPSTGGIGTTIFYVVGGLLMVAALVLFITKRKMNQK